ncbi:MAG TPA: hypothetical protein VGK67_30140 [Myxococcales bacterium]|jgi:4-amino-4-deoxy-L-arabinose transferase-like glycosyltransferase
MIIFGTRLFGEVDSVPGFFSVRTRFFHVNFLPLVPVASFLMFGPEQGVELGSVQWRSVLACWARTALIVGGGIALIAGMVMLGEKSDRSSGIGLLAAGALCGAALWASYRYLRASKARALELCELAGLSAEDKARLERHFGRLDRGGAEEF